MTRTFSNSPRNHGPVAELDPFFLDRSLGTSSAKECTGSASGDDAFRHRDAHGGVTSERTPEPPHRGDSIDGAAAVAGQAVPSECAKDIDGVVLSVRAKAATEHRVPLSDAALALLDEARAIADPSGLVFLSVTGRRISDSTLSKLLREVMEAALAHRIPDTVEAVYFRSDLLDRRRVLAAA